MRKNFVSKLYDNLLNDEKYNEYCKIYEKERYIDLDLLKYLLETHHELYYIFLKINILLYFSRDDKIISKLNKDLRDYTHSNNKILRIDDMDLILRHYGTNYSRCRSCMMKIIKYNLVTKIEKEILMLIYGKDIQDLILPMLYDELDDES